MKKLSWTLSLVCALFLFSSCKKEEKHLIVIGTDGFSSEVITKNPGAFPNIEAMRNEGSHTLQRRSVLPSASACNWASMLMGASPELHGYTTWSSDKPDLPAREIGTFKRFPGIFGLIREQKPEAVTGFFYNWKTMDCLFDAGSENMKKQGKDAEIAEASINFYQEKNPHITFIAFGEPDGVGHGKGWDSPEYIEACKVIDKYVGEIRAAVSKSPVAANTYVIFTSDHGGIGKGHGGKTMSEMEAPFIITGPGIKKNHEITESVMIYDTASTIADIFGLKQPQVWIGRPIQSIKE